MYQRSDPPRIWLLTMHHVGDRQQLLNLAAGLAWPYEEKRLVFNRLGFLPNAVLKSCPAHLDGAKSAPLTPPWPDLVLASGRRSVPVARWIHRQNAGRTRLVHVGRPWAPLHLFDLIITTAQYGLPQQPNVLSNLLTLNRADPDRLREAAAAWLPRLRPLPRPWIAVLIGGDSRPYRLDRATAGQLAERISARARAEGGSLLITTSRRTSQGSRAAILERLDPKVPRHLWTDSGDNPYLAYLALADRFVVTGDSASMISEAYGTGQPVEVYDLPARPDLRWRLAQSWRACAGASGPVGRQLYGWLVDQGLVTSNRDMAHFGELLRHAQTTDQGHVRELDVLALAVARTRQLMRLEEEGSAIRDGAAQRGSDSRSVA